MQFLKLVFVDESRVLKRPRLLWRLIAQTVLFFLIVAVSSELVRLIERILGGDNEYFGSGVVEASSAVLFVIAAFVSVWLAGRFFDRRRFRDFGFRLSRGWWLDLGFGLVLGAGLMTGIVLAMLVLGWVRVDWVMQSTIPGTPFWIAILLPVLIFSCVGIWEEVFYRGYQLLNLAEGLNFSVIGPRVAVILAVVLSSAFFGVTHATNPNASVVSTVGVTLAGLLFALGYMLTGELAIPIGLHITANFFQAAVFGFPTSGQEPVGASFLSSQETGPDLLTGGNFGPEAGLLGVVAIIVSSALILLWVRLRRGKITFALAESLQSAKAAGSSERVK